MATKKVKVYMTTRVTIEHEYEAPVEQADELLSLAKSGRWGAVGEWFDDPKNVTDSEVDTDSIVLSIDGKLIYQDD